MLNNQTLTYGALSNEDLNSGALMKAIKRGAHRVILVRNDLNRLNVFPVADSDTGNNLVSLMRSILSALSNRHETVSDTLHAIAKQALIGAKGNSGMIFAQYINGVAKNYHPNNGESNEALVTAFYHAVTDAFQAVFDPQEGTMLSVMKSWANSLYSSFGTAPLSETLMSAKQEAYVTLQDTKTVHPILRKHGVMDAGAQGFYEFIAGLTDALLGEEEELEFSEEIEMGLAMDEYIHTEAHHEVHADHAPELRYCMEMVIEGGHRPAEVMPLVQEFGDSLVVATGVASTRIHLHTDVPQEVVPRMEQLGAITHIKADDMKQQYYDAHVNTMKTAIVTDSIADIPQHLIDEHNIHIIPLTILVDDVEHLDKITMSNQKVVDLADDEQRTVSSSMMTQAQILRMLDGLESSYENVLFITVSSKLSGVYQGVFKAMESYQGRLHTAVIDSKLNSIAQGLLVQKAIQYVQADMPFEHIQQSIMEARDRAAIYVSVSDLAPMIRSGRIPQRLGKIVKKLQLKPIVKLDSLGSGALAHIGFTTSGNQKKIKKIILKNKKIIERIAIGYTTSVEDANKWATYFEAEGIPVDYVTTTSSIIALSAGKNATAVAVIYKEDIHDLS
jgi:DegV family protein with EDD domain